ncbi:MAG: protein kinase [Nannocystis sp.]|nr:protein kinase [Nannocystis sp.]
MTPPTTLPPRRPPPAQRSAVPPARELGALPTRPRPAPGPAPGVGPVAPRQPGRPDLEDTIVATGGPPPPAGALTRAPLSGVLCERYHIRGRLDEGGEGVVYDAWDQLEHRPLALKVRSRLVGHDHLLLKREYQALSAVRHVNVARAFDFVEDVDRGLAFFTMELVSGVDFVAHARRPAQRHACQADLGRLRRITRQVALGLQAIHGAGRAHRDIKPSNILITDDERAVILDFGLAARLSGDDQLTLRVRRVEGTPHYMAPEQLCADAPITAACDCYALGVVLYEAVTGRWPLDSQSLTELITLKRYRAPKPPSALVRGLTRELDGLIVRLLERDPGARATLSDVLAWCGEATHPSLAPPLTPRGASRSESPLASHRRPLIQLAGALRHLRRGDPRTVLFYGPAGAGKSGLVRRALSAFSSVAPRALILSGRCNPRESVPFRALDAIVDALAAFLITCAEEERQELLSGGCAHLAQLFPVFARVPGVDPPQPHYDRGGAARDRAFAELRALLQRLAAARPLALFIDDLHRSDRDSLRLLGALTAQPSAPAMLVIATMRCGAEEARQLASGLRGAHELHEVPLPTPEEARPLALARLREAGRDDHELAAALAQACGGDVRLISRVAEIVAQRAYTPGNGPIRLAELIAPAVAELDPMARRLLELIAITEAPVPVDVLSRAADAQANTQANTRAQLAALGDRRLIELEANADDPTQATAECISPALRAALLDLIPAPRQQAHHRALASAHHSSPQGDEETCARHLIASGDRRGARDHAAGAAFIAHQALAFDHAAQLFELALLCDPESRELRIKLAAALAAAGEQHDAALHYLIAARSAAGRRRMELATTAADLFYLSGDHERGGRAADALLAEMGVSLPDEAEPRERLLDRYVALLRGHPLRFCAHTRAQVGGDYLQRVDTLVALGRHLLEIDPPRAALVLLPAALDALSIGEARLICQSLALCAATLTALDAPLARRLLARASELAAEAGDERGVGLTALCRARLALQDNDPLSALSELAIAEDALLASKIADRWEQRALTLARLAALDALGELGELRAAVRALQGDPIAAADPELRPWITLYQGLLFIADDEPERAELRSVAGLGELAARDPRLALALTARVAAQIDLYRELPRKAWSRVIGPKGHLRASARRGADPRVGAAYWRLLDARIALANVALRGRDQALYREVFEESLGHLDALAAAAPGHSGLHGEIALLRAGYASERGAPALPHLVRAEAHFLSAAMSTARAVVQIFLGERRGDREGAMLAASARQQLRRQGVADPDRWARAYAPALCRGSSRADGERAA